MGISDFEIIKLRPDQSKDIFICASAFDFLEKLTDG
jgi:hypothetical protein